MSFNLNAKKRYVPPKAEFIKKGDSKMVYEVTITKTCYVDVDNPSEIEDAVFSGGAFNESEEITDFHEAVIPF